MRRMLLRRLLWALLVLPGVVTLVFVVFSLLGDPARMVAGQRADVQTLANIRSDLGLDEPSFQQYLHYLDDLSPVCLLSTEQQVSGNYNYIELFKFVNKSSLVLKWPYLRRSYQSGQAVTSLLLERLPATALLAVSSLVLAALLGVAFGILAALKPNSWVDKTLSGLAVLGVSAPSFFVAVLLLWLLAIRAYPLLGLNLTGYIRSAKIYGIGYSYHWQNLILPTLALGTRPLALLFQLTRSGMLTALRADYIRTAYAQGLTLPRIILRHALPNALGPVVTSLSGWFAALLAGAFFVEYIFDWPGLGKLTVDALYTNDYPVVLGSCLFTAVLFIVFTLITELLYPLLDPRVRSVQR